MRTRSNSIARLDWYNRLVSRTILRYQDPVTGLLPPNLTWEQRNADCKEYLGDAWVRDNVYGVLAVWGLAQAYKKCADLDEDKAKAFELTQTVVKLMRGLLMCMMQQVQKVERFKQTQSKDDCLHAKYNIRTGTTVVGDQGWGHLQIDATSLFLLMLAQMTASGLQIIFTEDEVSFIQNLVFYIAEAYRIPDYGIWERGDKCNHGFPELNASSIGMAKAALEALNGIDLYGSRGGSSSVIHVLPDDILQCKAILQSMLPRESSSKEVAASLLSIISYPAFAVDDAHLVDMTREEILTKLQGRYGCKRFLRDGYKTPMEDSNRLHYEPAELKIFEGIECEWPLFYTYLILDGIYHNKPEQVKEYRELLEPLLIKDETGMPMVPELYYVPNDKVHLEYRDPHSQERQHGDKVLHIWSQALYILGCLLEEGFVATGEIDPLNKCQATAPKPDLVIQVVLIAENEEIKDLLDDLHVPIQTVEEVKPVQLLPAKNLNHAYRKLGKSNKLGLSGRPYHDIGVVATSTVYRMGESIFIFTPQFLDYHQFYLALDNEFGADVFRSLLEYLGSNWRMLGRPTVTVLLTNAMIENSLNSSIAKLIIKLKSGYCTGTRIRLGYISDFFSTSYIASLDFSQQEEDGESCMSPDERTKTDFLKTRKEFKGAPFRERSTSMVRSVSHRKSVTGIIRRSRSVSVYQEPNIHVGTGDEESPPLSPCQTTKGSMDVDIQELITELEEADCIQDQADILHVLFNMKGPHFDTKMQGVDGSTVRKLLEELYEKACASKTWSLVRHTAGMLQKRVDELAEAVTNLLLRQKQLSVGLPVAGKEHTITRPLPPDELKSIIYNACGEDSSTGVVTQELLVYLSMFVKTEPSLFNEMLRVRVGLIIEVMVSELQRALDCPADDVSEYFMSLSPFEMKTLLYHILSGKEFGVSEAGSRNISQRQISIINIDLPKRIGVKKLKSAIKHMSARKHRRMRRTYHPPEHHPPPVEDPYGSSSDMSEAEDDHASQCDRQGQWLRRRCLDGALNRVPVGFYPRVWMVLEKCHGISIEGHFLPQAMVQEMTAGELKFALCVEGAMNRIPQPEYRQLMVESLVVLASVVENYQVLTLGEVIELDALVYEAYQLWLQEQTKMKGDATICCARPQEDRISCGGAAGICRHFYDSAPSGRYGTMTYVSQAVAQRLQRIPHSVECVVS